MASKQEIASLFVSLRASTSKFDRDISRARTKAKSGLGSLGTVIGTGLIAATAAVGAAAISASLKFEKAFKTLASDTGLTGDALKELGNATKAVFSNSVLEIDDVAKGMASLNTNFGLTGDAATAVGDKIASLANISGTAMGILTESVSRLFKNFNTPPEQFTEELNRMFRVSQTTGTALTDLLRITESYQPSLSALGLSMGETIAFFGQMTQSGVKAERAMAGVQAATRKLSDGSLDQELGVRIGDSLRVKFEAVLNLLSSIEDEQSRIARATKIFGAEGAIAISKFIENGFTGIEKLQDSIKGYENSIKQSEIAGQTSGDKFKQIWNEVQITLLPLGDILLEIAISILPAVTAGLEALSALVTAVSPIIRTLGTVVTETFNIISDLITGFVDLLTGDTENAIEDLGRTFERIFRGIQNFVSGTMNFISESITAFIEKMSQIFDAVSPLIEGLFGLLGGGQSAGSSGGGGGLPGFASGGSFEVGRGGLSSAPVDSQLIAFMATPGEQVSVSTPQQRRAAEQAIAGSSGNSQDVILNISTGVSETVRAELISMMPAIKKELESTLTRQVRRNTRFSSDIRYRI